MQCVSDGWLVVQVWIMAAQFEIRQHRLGAARQILGMALGSCPKDKLFKAYIDAEYSLGNMDRRARLRSRPVCRRVTSAPGAKVAGCNISAAAGYTKSNSSCITSLPCNSSTAGSVFEADLA